MKLALVALCLAALAGCSLHDQSTASQPFAKHVSVAPHLRLWIQCSGSGPVVLADNGLAIPTEAWAGVRKRVRHVTFCAFDRAGVGRSDGRFPARGTLERNVKDIHALIRAAGLKRPVILAGHSTGGLDALLYAREYPADVDGLVLIDAPSESAPPPPATLEDGSTELDFHSGLRKLRRAGNLGDLPLIVLSHGRRSYSTEQAEQSWTRMQRQLARDSSNTLRVVALDSDHFIQDDQPGLVAAAFDEAGMSFPKKQQLRCSAVYADNRGRCVLGD